MEVFLECCMTLFFSAAMLLLIVRLAKGEERKYDVCACVLPGVQRRFLDWHRPHRCAEPERFLMFFYITGAMLSYTAMVLPCRIKKEQISRQQA